MARIFPDTSAVVKLYRAEPNSAIVKACIALTDDLVIAQITPLEFRSACYGLVRQKLITSADALVYITSFFQSLSAYEIVTADVRVFQEAALLLDTYAAANSLRPLDALQLASALVENARNPIDVFLTTDQTLARIAAASGFVVKP